MERGTRWSGSKRHPEWASSQARPGEQKEGSSDRYGGLSLLWPSGTFPGLWTGDVKDLTPLFLALLRLQSTFAFACRRPCTGRRDICTVPIASEKQKFQGGGGDPRMGWDSVVQVGLGEDGGGRGGLPEARSWRPAVGSGSPGSLTLLTTCRIDCYHRFHLTTGRVLGTCPDLMFLNYSDLTSSPR